LKKVTNLTSTASSRRYRKPQAIALQIVEATVGGAGDVQAVEVVDAIVVVATAAVEGMVVMAVEAVGTRFFSV
jgi:hypothetical protein